AEQTARARALHREHELSGLIRATWLGTFLIWLVVVGVVLLFQSSIMAQWKITNPAALWLTLPVLHYYAPGMVLGILAGLSLALVLAIWPTRSLWLPSPQSFEWRSLLRQIIPLTLGFGAYQFMLTADTMLVRGCFSDADSAFYVSAGTLSRASMWLVGPLATVMFPKIVHAKAKAEKSDLMSVVLLGTVILAAGGAIGLCVLGPWVVGIVFGETFVKADSILLPWYAWAVVPLSVANVLLNNLLARSLFKVVPALCVLVVVYTLALTQFHDTPVMVIKTLGVCNVLLLAVC